MRRFGKVEEITDVVLSLHQTATSPAKLYITGFGWCSVRLTNPCTTMGQCENVDSRSLGGPLRRVPEETFRITYSIVKIAQTRIVEPIHPLLNKKMLAHLSAEIISSSQQSNLRLRLAVLNEIGGGRG